MKTTQDTNTWEIITTFSSEEEKETVFRLIERHILLMSKAYRKRTCNWGIVRDLTRHGSGYSMSICKALGVEPGGYEWKVEENENKRNIYRISYKETNN